MFKMIRCFAPVVLSTFFFVIIVGQGWAQEKILYQSKNITPNNKISLSHEITTNKTIWPFVPEFRVFKSAEFDLVFNIDSFLMPIDQKTIKIEMVDPDKFQENIIILTSEASFSETSNLSKEDENKRTEIYRDLERKESVRNPGLENVHLKENRGSQIKYQIKLKALNTSKNHIKWKIITSNNEELYYFTEIWVLPGWDFSNLIFGTGLLLSEIAFSVRLILAIPPLFLYYPDLVVTTSNITQYGVNLMGISFINFIGYELVVHNIYMNNLIKETQ